MLDMLPKLQARGTFLYSTANSISVQNKSLVTTLFKGTKRTSLSLLGSHWCSWVCVPTNAVPMSAAYEAQEGARG